MEFNYRKLRGRIVEICGTQAEFATRMNKSERTISLKLQGKIPWGQEEIMNALDVLQLDATDVQEYFFNVQNVQSI